MSCHTLRKADFEHGLVDDCTGQAVDAGLAVLRPLQQESRRLERLALEAVKMSDDFQILQTIKGVGPILGLTIMLEVGDIRCFPSAGDFVSYCRCVDGQRMSNGKKKGTGNAEAGNKFLSWAFSEAAHFAVRFEPLAQRFYARKKAKTNGMNAIRAVAGKRARASWMMLRHQTPYEARLMFPG